MHHSLVWNIYKPLRYQIYTDVWWTIAAGKLHDPLSYLLVSVNRMSKIFNPD